MKCYICYDKGVVPFTVKQYDFDYQYLARCTCETGMAIQGKGFVALKAAFTDFEISEIKKNNKKKMDEAETNN